MLEDREEVWGEKNVTLKPPRTAFVARRRMLPSEGSILRLATNAVRGGFNVTFFSPHTSSRSSSIYSDHGRAQGDSEVLPAGLRPVEDSARKETQEPGHDG